MAVAQEVGSSFAHDFLQCLAAQQYHEAAKFFLLESEHASVLTVVQGSKTDVFHGQEILAALNHVFAAIAHKEVVIESVTADGVHAGVVTVVTFTSENVEGSLVACLEHYDDESFFVKNIAATVTNLAPVVPAHVHEEPVIAEEAVVEAPVAEAVAVSETVLPVVEEAPAAEAPAKGKKAKKGKATATVAAPVEDAPVSVPAETVEESPVAPPVAEPVAEVVEQPIEQPSASKSWAALAAARPTTSAAPARPQKVTPPTAAAPAEVATAAVPKEAKETKEFKEKAPRREEKPRPEASGDRLMFNVNHEVSDDDIKNALGPLAKSIHSLRNQSKQGRVFIDFSVTTAYDTLKDKFAIGSTKINVYKQKAKEETKTA